MINSRIMPSHEPREIARSRTSSWVHAVAALSSPLVAPLSRSAWPRDPYVRDVPVGDLNGLSSPPPLTTIIFVGHLPLGRPKFIESSLCGRPSAALDYRAPGLRCALSLAIRPGCRVIREGVVLNSIAPKAKCCTTQVGGLGGWATPVQVAQTAKIVEKLCHHGGLSDLFSSLEEHRRQPGPSATDCYLVKR